jgi:TPR repeat protein
MRYSRPFLFLILPVLVTCVPASLSQTPNETQQAALKSKSPSPKFSKEYEKTLLAKAQQGDADSQMWLGSAYEQGWFGKSNFPAALKWFRKSAEQDNPDAQNSLGYMYEYGECVAQNYALAAKWYGRAAEHVSDFGGAGQGRNHLGMLYLGGRGVPKDYVLAYMWVKLSRPDSNPNLSDAAAHMTPEQIAEAERLAARWNAQHPQPNHKAFHHRSE